MLSLFVLAPSALMAAAVSAPIDPPTVRQSKNGEFMTKYYPPISLKRGEQGKVSFEITVDRDGFLSSCIVTKTSGFANLDRETCEFLFKYAKLKPVRSSDGRTVTATQQGYMNWQLPKGARQLASADMSTALDPEKKICRRYPRTGSKVGSVKICMSRQEWADKERLAREDTEHAQTLRCPNAGSSGGMC